jgi:hypothetical protein
MDGMNPRGGLMQSAAPMVTYTPPQMMNVPPVESRKPRNVQQPDQPQSMQAGKQQAPVMMQPDMKQAQPDMKQAQPDMKQAQPDMKQAQPDMKQAQPDMKQAQPDMKQAQPDMKQAQPASTWQVVGFNLDDGQMGE